MLRAPPGCTALRPRRTTGWADGHGTATAGGVESVTSVPRVDDGAVSTKFASPPSPTGSSGPPSADASTTSPSASRSDNTGCAVAAGAGAPSTDTATASGRTGPVPSGTSTISRTWPSDHPGGHHHERWLGDGGRGADQGRHHQQQRRHEQRGGPVLCAGSLCVGGYLTGSADTMTLSR